MNTLSNSTNLSIAQSYQRGWEQAQQEFQRQEKRGKPNYRIKTQADLHRFIIT